MAVSPTGPSALRAGDHGHAGGEVADDRAGSGRRSGAMRGGRTVAADPPAARRRPQRRQSDRPAPGTRGRARRGAAAAVSYDAARPWSVVASCSEPLAASSPPASSPRAARRASAVGSTARLGARDGQARRRCSSPSAARAATRSTPPAPRARRATVGDRERVDGPNLNQRKETTDDVLYAIRNGGFSGAIMPAEHRRRAGRGGGRRVRRRVRGQGHEVRRPEHGRRIDRRAAGASGA